MDKAIYKYLPIARLSYLQDELLRITQPGDLNDPFECLPIPPSDQEMEKLLNDRIPTEQQTIDNIALSFKKKIQRKEQIKNIIKNEISKVKRGERNNLKETFYNNSRDHINKSVGILSFSRRWESTLMWSHYANSHNGFCVGFDRSNPFFMHYHNLNISDKNFMEVSYSENRIKIPTQKGDKIDPKVMLTKSPDWDYEKEERLLVRLSLAEKIINEKPFDIHLYKVPHSLITEITLGAKIDNSNEELFIEFCKARQIPLFKCQISETKFDMERFRIN